MNFSEKMVFLMNLTSTSNKQLAEAVMVDPSLISLLKTARRNPPKNNTYIKLMASYFAKKCEGNYQRVALSEAMGRKYLQLHMDVKQLASVLFDWLTDEENHVGQFLSTFDSFSFEEVKEKQDEHNDDSPAVPPLKNSSDSFAFYGNEGKRGALNAFMNHLMSLREPCTIMLSTDENQTWLFEDGAFLPNLQIQMMDLLKKGFRICRIAAPLHTSDMAFDSISMWLPLYMTKNVESFYYPRLRDNMYRRTLIVAPGAAVVSTSTKEQAVSRSTIFTKDHKLSAAFSGEFNDLLSKCLPLMTTYSNVSGISEKNDILQCISRFEEDKGERIQQSISLSSITSPPGLIGLIASKAPKGDDIAIINSISHAQAVFHQNLRTYEVTDIHSIATADEVRSGNVPIAAGYLVNGCDAYYTPDTYAKHLLSIIDHLKKYVNYHAILIPRSSSTHSLMVKDGRQALLIRPGVPLIIFEVSQQDIVEACREFLMRNIGNSLYEMTYSIFQRQETIEKLQAIVDDLQNNK